ncbi:glucosamine-6-phosphate deaminase 1 [Virgibacillus pantothenticus]|uniref:Glucosamine-6-phosphate deaminase n=1 Tax=Virgibacillus pantothenticus TaxID=1473 RepID=A0A0L0QMC7_VIRPA|nr:MULTISPECIES: glucosamine-6-phosphate deaminase [Virgibacillus]API93435.1 glucosamine-6-phosphate deaminase [Virgibacillus sp. 6R]KNE19752.1 glucosamine-6-phosphate deaminase [Virgibacillus pantothenticus]MBS7430192.1 glucosamine-6-phosphate deaminase [Virgibacillus sp. 19R1-5]MBU8566252.1 glucosamine-6-phosphate deaminase [Virgibacillus pantothenticus]MBU8600677.1 glucosamine-6-phosphate deaminase [Virgibacillus pantothenticus]
MELIKVRNYEELSEYAGKLVLEKVNTLENPVLGLATGSTPEGLYQYLINQYKEGKVSFEHVVTFNLDEYVGLEKDDINSYNYYMNEKLFKHIGIPRNQTYLPDGNAIDLNEEATNYENRIKQAGNIDLQILGLGLNGHIGFNEPGTPFTSRTHIVQLDESTRQANARFFISIDEVPSQAITMGIETIMESKQIVLLVSGEGKAEALHRVINGEVSEEFPASILQKHPHVIIVADEAACKLL